MACVLVPATEAIVATIATKIVKSHEDKAQTAPVNGVELETEGKLPFSRKLKWLSNLLWGGSALLGFEHVWHGEIAPFFPFLTAAATPEGTQAMLHEMATAGVGMAAVVTAVWAGIVGVTSAMEKRTLGLGTANR